MAIALLLAAGLGERLGLGCPKALAELAGRPLWRWSADVLLAEPEIERVVLATPRGGKGEALAASVPSGVTAVGGGAVRSESVLFALQAAAKGGVGPGPGSGAEAEAEAASFYPSSSADFDAAYASASDSDSLVLVHDAARPLLSAELVRGVLAAAAREGVDAAIAATPVTDTIKQVDAAGRVTSTLDRSGLWSVQTPQVFRRGALERALDVGADVLAQATDDAWLIERAGGCVAVVPASRENLKVTTPVDLELAELLLARRGDRTRA
ncbi:MAG TPA: IspD/TarI family cytidylyltransferase [Solirubrobacteraceae bacterium]|nr:IspD/TarI family cytidylyltransferase [Solirubrobacteraceae bacterium]